MKKNQTTYTDIMKPGCFIGAVLTASGIENALVIFHGISGCNIESIHFRSEQIPDGSYVPIIPTGLVESDCVNGASDKLFRTLRDTIKQSVKKNKPPSIVFVVTSDATSIVGDDIHTTGKIVEEETGIKIITLDTPSFIGGVVKGTDLTLKVLISKFITKQKTTQKGLNLIAPYLIGSKNWTNDSNEMIRLLEESEVTVNTNLCRNFNVKNIDEFTNAKFNYILSGDSLPEFEELSQKYNIKTFNTNLPLPIGAANTEEWLLSIAKAIGNIDKAKLILEKDQQLVTSQLKYNYNFSWMSTLMHGKYTAILGNAKFVASLARCLFWDFGIMPKVLGLICESEQAYEQALELLKPLEENFNIKILKNPNYFEYGNLIKNEKIDFAIGAIQDKPLCIGHKIPHLSLTGYNFFNQYNFIPWPYFGIRGILGILSELSRIMEESFYMKDMISEYNYKGCK